MGPARLQTCTTSTGFIKTYEAGIQNFWSSQGVSADLTSEQDIGAAIAQIILDKRKRVLCLVLKRIAAFSAPAFLIGILIGMKPEQAVLAVIPASAVAVFSAKE